MNQTDFPAAVGDIDFVIQSIAKSAIDNDKHFGELDAVVVDAMSVTSKIGGTSGPLWARGFYAPQRSRATVLR